MKEDRPCCILRKLNEVPTKDLTECEVVGLNRYRQI